MNLVGLFFVLMELTFSDSLGEVAFGFTAAEGENPRVVFGLVGLSSPSMSDIVGVVYLVVGLLVPTDLFSLLNIFCSLKRREPLKIDRIGARIEKLKKCPAESTGKGPLYNSWCNTSEKST